MSEDYIFLQAILISSGVVLVFLGRRFLALAAEGGKVRSLAADPSPFQKYRDL